MPVEAQGEMKMKMCLNFKLMRKGNPVSSGENLTHILVNLARRGTALRLVLLI